MVEQYQKLLLALRETLATLQRENERPGGSITDTIWHSPCETLFDYIEGAISSAAEAQPVSGEPSGYESTTAAYTRFISPGRYRKLKPEFQRWYRPYWMSGLWRYEFAELARLDKAEAAALKRHIDSYFEPGKLATEVRLVERAGEVVARMTSLAPDQRCRPQCRDCADFGPVCPNSGKPCGGVAEQAEKAQPRRLRPFDAVAEAMRLASLMGGSIGMSDVEKTEDYERRLRAHLIEFMYPQAEQADKVQPAHISAVGEVKFNDDGEPHVSWYLEGGPYELADGEVLLVADREMTDADGHAEVYTIPTAAPAQPLASKPSNDAMPASCAAGRDGDCVHPQCPQRRDGEPLKSGRHCPLDGQQQ